MLFKNYFVSSISWSVSRLLSARDYVKGIVDNGMRASTVHTKLYRLNLLVPPEEVVSPVLHGTTMALVCLPVRWLCILLLFFEFSGYTLLLILVRAFLYGYFIIFSAVFTCRTILLSLGVLFHYSMHETYCVVICTSQLVNISLHGGCWRLAFCCKNYMLEDCGFTLASRLFVTVIDSFI